MPAPEKIKQLVQTFEQNLKEYQTRKNETELRRQFLDPFFEALGWDVSNNKGLDERRKEVAHEFSVEIDGQQKKADYAFRTGTRTSADQFDFLAEAKKPSVKIESNKDPAFQIKRYGWSAKLPINILTDFEHFAVYDCRAKPKYEDKVTVGRMHLFHYKEYVEKWDEIAALFSPEAVREGALNKYAEVSKGSRGTADVDDDFLAEIERWRDLLARNIANRNKDKHLTESQLNFAVQMTIDRIVFLRIAEERGMEEYRRLQNVSRQENIYSELKKLFLKADERYNSGLFHFKAEKERKNPDTLTFELQIDDKVLKDIIENLYEPKSPYAFAYIPADILGSIYERFLGKVIRLTAGGQARVEDKPEVRKAGGVYYTPVYIVEYIVKNTVGKLLLSEAEQFTAKSAKNAKDIKNLGDLSELRGSKSLTPKEASDLKIVDPACGSGSFLLGAYQYLLNWHLDWYVQNDPEKHLKNKVLLTQDNKTYRLSMTEKKRILLNNIHGVDVDPQAVEVTKLSLLLKVVEDPGQLTMFEEGHILPDLGNNIKCGNSLIGMDYFEGQLMTDAAEMARVNPFDWKVEFPQVFKHGGFDAVVGNPPYVRSINLKESDPLLWDIYRNKYKSASEREWDIYLIFVEKAITLLKEGGLLGYILPNKFLNSQVGSNLRDLLSSGNWLRKIIHFGAFQIFEGVTTYTCLLFLGQNKLSNLINVDRYIGNVKKSSKRCAMPEEASELWATYELEEKNLSSAPWEFSVSQSGLVEKIRRFPKLQDVAKVYQDTGTRADKVFAVKSLNNTVGNYQVYSEETGKEYLLEADFLRPVLKGRDISRYGLDNKSSLLVLPYEIKDNKVMLVSERTLLNKAPETIKYLLECKPRLNERENGRFKGDGWYCYGRPQNMDKFEIPEKIVLPDIANRGAGYLDTEQRWILDTAYAIVPLSGQQLNIRYLLGVLNSPLLTYFLKETGTALRGGYFRMKTAYLNPFPIRPINFSDPVEKAKHDQMVTLVERMLALHKNLASAKTPQEKESVQRQIESTDGAIDSLVYELYGLTEEEIKIVEGSQ